MANGARFSTRFGWARAVRPTHTAASSGVSRVPKAHARPPGRYGAADEVERRQAETEERAPEQHREVGGHRVAVAHSERRITARLARAGTLPGSGPGCPSYGRASRGVGRPGASRLEGHPLGRATRRGGLRPRPRGIFQDLLDPQEVARALVPPNGAAAVWGARQAPGPTEKRARRTTDIPTSAPRPRTHSTPFRTSGVQRVGGNC
jgi:hypothetical protein